MDNRYFQITTLLNRALVKLGDQQNADDAMLAYLIEQAKAKAIELRGDIRVDEELFDQFKEPN